MIAFLKIQCCDIVRYVMNLVENPHIREMFSAKGGDREALANIIGQICEMFSALPLTFCAVPPITHSRQAQAGADLGNGLPQTHLSSSSS